MINPIIVYKDTTGMTNHIITIEQLSPLVPNSKFGVHVHKSLNLGLITVTNSGEVGGKDAPGEGGAKRLVLLLSAVGSSGCIHRYTSGGPNEAPACSEALYRLHSGFCSSGPNTYTHFSSLTHPEATK